MINKGQKIKVKDNVVTELMKLGFEKGSAESMKVFENTEQTAHDIYEDEGTTYVTVEMCCEIPLQCCEALEEKEDIENIATKNKIDLKRLKLAKECIGIVNQLYDLAEVSVEKRQAINDEADKYLLDQVLRLSGVSKQSEPLNKLLQPISDKEIIKQILDEYGTWKDSDRDNAEQRVIYEHNLPEVIELIKNLINKR